MCQKLYTCLGGEVTVLIINHTVTTPVMSCTLAPVRPGIKQKTKQWDAQKGCGRVGTLHTPSSSVIKNGQRQKSDTVIKIFLFTN